MNLLLVSTDFPGENILKKIPDSQISGPGDSFSTLVTSIKQR